MTADLEILRSSIASIRAEVKKVMIGQDQTLDAAMVVILTGQHALLEGPPGVGKTPSSGFEKLRIP